MNIHHSQDRKLSDEGLYQKVLIRSEEMTSLSMRRRALDSGSTLHF